jgi:hypothetical protein
MEWMIKPLAGFNEIISSAAAGCTDVWAECTCTGGLLVCEVKGALAVQQQSDR